MSRFSYSVDPREAVGPISANRGQISRAAARIRELEEALRRTEEKLRVALDTARLGAWELDLRTGEFSASATCKANVGLPANALLTYDMFQAMRDPDDGERVAQAIRTAIETGQDYDVEYGVNRADGSVGRVTGRGHAAYENGVAVRIIGVTLDVTDRERDRQALLDLERRQRFLLDLNDRLRSAEDPASVMTTASAMLGAHLGANRAGYAEIGHADHLFVGSDWADAPRDPAMPCLRLVDFGPEISADLNQGRTVAVYDVATDARSAGNAKTIEAAGVKSVLAVPLVKEGRLVSIVYLQQAQPRAWSVEEISLAEDVAERTWAAVGRARAEAELRVSEAKFRMIGEALPAFVWVLGKDLQLTYVNERWITYSGLPPGEALGFSWMEAIHPDDLKEIAAAIRDVLVPTETAHTLEAR
jgi:PAS domain S-box-containing protein